METLSEERPSEKLNLLLLFLASFLALFFELVIIRYISTEIRIFAYIKNLPLLASFLGIAVGMILGRPPKRLLALFPALAAVLFLVAAYSGPLRIQHLPFPSTSYQFWGVQSQSSLGAAIKFFGITLGVLTGVVGFFVVLGGLVGQYLSATPSLQGYGVNLAGSLVGVAVFSLLAWWETPPAVWLAVGLLTAFPFLFRKWFALATFVLVLLAASFTGGHALWSPYYRIDLFQAKALKDWARPPAHFLFVNHDNHQRLLDLSPEFLSRFPNYEPNKSAFNTYELPYFLVDQPGEVLVVGAGSGNDVAAALRHGAAHVDAVEIDPLIVKIGRRYHPERSYDSPRVSIHINDARAFFRQTQKKYDLIVFGYLDSHTLIASYSSLRLDSYVYTLESFREARGLLKPEGTLVLLFGSGDTFITYRLFATLTRAFQVSPLAYETEMDYGVAFVEGKARENPKATPLPEITKHLQGSQRGMPLTTDRWPFLYLARPAIPGPILVVLLLFLAAAAILVRRTAGLQRFSRREDLHFFLLGAGFLLLETKAVTELALLFGSTWSVNAVVIGSFLAMAMLANLLVIRHPVPRLLAYGGLLTATALNTVFPYGSLNALPFPAKLLLACIIAGLPVFFSGLVFSSSFRDVPFPSQALGLNLLGSMVGGALENAVMIWGMAILGALAFLIFACSAVACPRTGQRLHVSQAVSHSGAVLDSGS